MSEDKPKTWKIISNFSSSNWFSAISSRIIFTPLFFLKVLKTPSLTIRGISATLPFGNFRGQNTSLALYEKSVSLRNLIQRVLVLTEERIVKRGKRFHLIRQRINVGEAKGYSITIEEGESAIDRLNNFVVDRGWTQPCTDLFRFPREIDVVKLVAVCVHNIDGKIVCISAALYYKDYGKNFFCLALERGEPRWMAMEKLIELLYERKVEYIHSEGLLGLDNGNYFFQEKLGYRSFNLKRAHEN